MVLRMFTGSIQSVSKTPQSGEFVGGLHNQGAGLPWGIPLKIAVGIVDYEGERIMAGPEDAVAKYSENYVGFKARFH